MSRRRHVDPTRRPASASGPAPVPPGAGKPLEAQTRVRMEQAFSSDFSHVRVHTGAAAGAYAQALGARALTIGDRIVFGEGRYRPGTPEGERLLAHELTHVLQPAPASTQTPLVAPAGSAGEHEAERMADAVAGRSSLSSVPMSSGAMPAPAAQAGGWIQRDPLPGMDSLPPLRGGDALLDNASPFLAAAAGSTTLDDFDTGKSDLKPDHQRRLDATARNIKTLLDQYPLSSIRVVGHADTVGEEAKNLALGDARAATVRQALVDLGIADSLIETTSVGEGKPQAVQTKDEAPNAKNRRVEVRFEPKKMQFRGLFTGGLTPPSSDAGTAAPALPSGDLLDPFGIKKGLLFPPTLPGPRNDGVQLSPDLWKPLPPPIKGTEPKSPIDAIAGAIVDPVIDKTLPFLSNDLRQKIKDGARAGIVKGSSKGARAIAEANGVTDPQALEAIEKATEAAMKTKPGAQQP